MISGSRMRNGRARRIRLISIRPVDQARTPHAVAKAIVPQAGGEEGVNSCPPGECGRTRAPATSVESANRCAPVADRGAPT